MLEVMDVDAGYGSKQVLHQVSLQARSGEIVAIIGPNGSGKSTVLRAIFGLVPVWNGRITWEGVDRTNWKPAENVRTGLHYVPQGARVFTDLSVIENLQIGGYCLPERRELERAIEAVFKRFPVLKKRRSQRAAYLSAGEQQMLALGRALMLRSKLLLLDEPSLGLSPQLVRSVMATIRAINHDLGVAIVLVEQRAREALAIANRAYAIKLGHVVFGGPADDLLDDRRLREVFL